MSLLLSLHLIEKILERPEACLVAVDSAFTGSDSAADLRAERPVAREPELT
jgi:hypothetical protein